MINDDIFRKLQILSSAARYDAACTSSGVARSGPSSAGANMLGVADRHASMGSTAACGICHCFSGDGRCISLLKILYSNHCIHDCKYCINRRSNDIPRATFTPEEIADLTISFYRRNYIEGLFLSSGVTGNPTDTMEQMYRAILLLRRKHGFNGYIHVKAIPGADSEIIDRMGWLADRMSVNLELPTSESLKKLAPGKSRKTILTPMRNIQLMRDNDRAFHGELLADNRVYYDSNQYYDSSYGTGSHKNTPTAKIFPADAAPDNNAVADLHTTDLYTTDLTSKRMFRQPAIMRAGELRYVPAGQSTQLVIGATDDTDQEIIKVSEALYDRFDLKRVFYSAFINVNYDSDLPDTSVDGPPLLREHRLYQADWLLRFYHFTADEIITPEHPMLNTLIDPKCNYALNNLGMFPVEVTTAPYKTLLRVPGIGVTSAKRIIKARNNAPGCLLTFNDLKKLGIVLKRAQYFITCAGKSMIPLKMTQSFILANLLGLKERLPGHITREETYKQLSIFDVSPEFVLRQAN